MGKKKNKFKKQGPKVQPVTQIERKLDQAIATETNTEDVKLETPAIVETDEIAILNEKYKFVRRDVKKLLIVLGILAVILVGIYIINIKTPFLTTVGDWIYKIGNFQI
jgi:hypothetical protein